MVRALLASVVIAVTTAPAASAQEAVLDRARFEATLTALLGHVPPAVAAGTGDEDHPADNDDDDRGLAYDLGRVTGVVAFGVAVAMVIRYFNRRP